MSDKEKRKVASLLKKTVGVIPELDESETESEEEMFYPPVPMK